MILYRQANSTLAAVRTRDALPIDPRQQRAPEIDCSREPGSDRSLAAERGPFRVRHGPRACLLRDRMPPLLLPQARIAARHGHYPCVSPS